MLHDALQLREHFTGDEILVHGRDGIGLEEALLNTLSTRRDNWSALYRLIQAFDFALLLLAARACHPALCRLGAQMPTRRKALGVVAQAAAGLALLPFAPRRAGSSVLVNDIHSQLNPTRVDRIVAIDSEATLRAALAAARVEGKPVCVAGGRHAMGGQQFAEDAVLLDVRPMRRIIGLSAEHGVVEAEAGVQWPELIEHLIGMQRGQRAAWGIIQKQTGADRLTLGGALGANIHGRGLALKPIIGDVESFTLMQADGSLSICSRSENAELFRLAIGGYGLFGVVTRVRLRLRRRTKLERVVRIIDIDDLMPAFAERIGEGYIYGDCQFSTDASSET